MWKDVMLGVLPVLAALGGVWLAHYLTMQQQFKISRVEYAREALRRVRLYCDNMESVVRWVAFSLIAREAGLPDEAEDEMIKTLNLDKVFEELAQPQTPEIPDEKIQTQWKEVAILFTKLMINKAIMDSTKLSKQQPKEILSALGKLQAIFGTADLTDLRAQIKNEKNLPVYDAADSLLKEVEGLRALVMRASTQA